MLFELQPRRDSAEQHQFLVLADPQTQTRAETGYFNDETVPDVQALLKSRAGIPTFGVGCGDMMWDDLSLFPQHERGVTAMGVPFFQVIGNHDLDLLARSDEGSCRTFRRLLRSHLLLLQRRRHPLRGAGRCDVARVGTSDTSTSVS